MTEMLLYTWEKSMRTLIMSSIYAVCLICVRKQMYIVLPIMLLVYIVQVFRREIKLKKLLVNIGMLMMIFLVSVGADVFYN